MIMEKKDLTFLLLQLQKNANKNELFKSELDLGDQRYSSNNPEHQN